MEQVAVCFHVAILLMLNYFFLLPSFVGFCDWCLLSVVDVSLLSSFAIISLRERKRERVSELFSRVIAVGWMPMPCALSLRYMY